MAVTHTEDFAGSAGSIDGDAPTTGAGAWTVSSGNTATWYIGRDGSGAGSSVGSGNKCAYLNAGSADHYAALSYLGANANYGVAVRVVTSSNLIALRRWSSTTVDLIKRVSGTQTTVVSITGLATFVAGDVFALEASGSAPVNVKVYKNGVQIGDSAGYDISDSVFDGVTNVGVWGSSSAATSSFDAWEGGTLVSDTLTIGTGPASRQIYQRPPTGDFALALSGTFAGATPDDIEWRLEDQAGALKTGYDWQTAAPTIGSGTWSLTVDVPPDTDQGGYILKLRSVDSGSTVLAATQTNGFTVGDNWIGIGQSNMDGLSSSTSGEAPTNPNAIFDDGALTWGIGAARIGYFLNDLAALRGVPQGFTNTGVGATGIRYHAPAHTSTDGSVSEGTNWPVIEDAVLAMGGVCGELRMIGENDSSGALTKTQLKDAYDAIRNGLATLAGRSGADFETAYMVTGRNDGGSGTDSLWQANREAQAEWCAATTGAYIAGDAITLSMSDNLHYDSAGYIEMARRIARSAAYYSGDSAYDARGPLIAGASIVGSTVTVTFDLNGSSALTGSGTLDGWEYYDGSWNAATDAARSGNTVTFTGAGATQIRYLYGADPVVANVVRGDVKADAASPDYLPAEPTRGAVAVTSGVDLVANKATASATAMPANVVQSTTLAAAKASASAEARSAIITSGSTVVAGKAVAASGALLASVSRGRNIAALKVTASASAFLIDIANRTTISGEKVDAAAAAFPGVVVRGRTIIAQKAIASGVSRRAAINGNLDDGDGGESGLIVNVGRLLSRF